MKKADIILIMMVLIITTSLAISQNFIRKHNAYYVVISIDAQEYKRLPLRRDETLTITTNEFINTIEVKNGKAKMISANCPDLTCVKQKSISLDGETIICLPHKIIIETKSAKQ